MSRKLIFYPQTVTVMTVMKTLAAEGLDVSEIIAAKFIAVDPELCPKILVSSESEVKAGELVAMEMESKKYEEQTRFIWRSLDYFSQP